MPLGEGYWLNARTGEEIEVWEHAKTVLENPTKFGLHPDAVSDKSQAVYAKDPGMRRQLLTDVMKRGWIRVRSYKGRNVFETAGVNDDALYSILEFAQAHNMWDNDRVLINDVTKPEGHGSMSMTVGQLQKQFGMGEQLVNVRKVGRCTATVWTDLIEGVDGPEIQRLRELLVYAVHLILDPSHVPWSVTETRDNQDQMKFEIVAYNYSMLTESELHPMPVYGLKTPMEHLDKMMQGVNNVLNTSIKRELPGKFSAGVIEVEQHTITRL